MEIWIRQAWFYRETTAGPSKNVPAVHQMTRMNLTQFDYKHRDWSNRPSWGFHPDRKKGLDPIFIKVNFLKQFFSERSNKAITYRLVTQGEGKSQQKGLDNIYVL
jgi:hypothetical protein